MRKIWELPGGIHPEEHKKQSLNDGIGQLPIPAQLIVPLGQHIGAPAKPSVAVGDTVLKGQQIATANGFVSAAIHAPSSGTVAAIESRAIPHSSGMEARCIVIDTDGNDQWIEHQGVDDYLDISPLELLTLIRESGIAGMGGAGFPSSVKLAPREPVDTLIINATECEPYITADDSLIREKAAEIVEGIKMLAHILGEPENIIIGIEDNKSEAYAALEEQIQGSRIELVDFHTKYPSGGEKQLIYILTGKEVPSGGLPAQIGIVCQNIGTVQAIYRTIAHGEPLISRITTLTGDALQTQRNFETLIGTPVQHLLDHCGLDQARCSRLVMGGPMMGFTLTDTQVPVVKTTNCILAPTQQELPSPPPAQPCIRCGLCAEACPASLLPQQLLWYAQSQNHERLEAHNLFDCIECGACSYVCPSAIPLVQYYRAAKGEIRDQQKKKLKSDKARERFEYNKARKEREEAEKTAKREARKKAAAEAKAKAAAEPAAATAPKPADDIVQAAMARVAQKKASPEQQLPRLERAVTSAENRVEVAQQKLAEFKRDTPEDQVEQGKAKLQDAQRRLSEAQQKLAALKAESAVATPEVKEDATEKVSKEAAKDINEKLTASPRDLLKKKLAGINERIATTEQKMAEASDEKIRTALQAGLNKQQSKKQEVEQQLAETPEGAVAESPTAAQETDAATLAIARAQARASAMAEMSEQDKLKDSITSLEKRIGKAETKLKTAEEAGSEHVDALRTGLEKMHTKLANNKQQLDKLEGVN